MSRFQVLMLAFVLAFCTSNAQAATPQVDSIFQPLFHVRIQNSLSNPQDILVAHCKSKENDLGFKRLAVNTYYQFQFHINFRSSTLFFCNLWHGDHQQYHAVFDAFIADNGFIRSCGAPGTLCTWIAQDDGIYLNNREKNINVFKYKWDLVAANAPISS